MPNPIYTTSVKPYTYLIKHLPTGDVYYGVRWANVLPPEKDLFHIYFTSSHKVKLLLEEGCVDDFQWEVRRVFDTAEAARKWEATVLRRLKIQKKDYWINQGIPGNYLYSKRSQEKKRKTSRNNFGVDHPLQSEEVREKGKQTLLERYGVEFYSQTEEYKEQMRQINQEKYGVDCVFQSEEVKNKIKQKNLENYGVEYVSQAEKVRKKISAAHMGKKKSAEHARNIGKSKTGENNPWFGKHRSDEEKKKISEGMKKVAAEEDKTPITCPHCGVKGQPRGMKSNHFDNCPEKPGNSPRVNPVRVCSHCGEAGRGGAMTRYHFDNCPHHPESDKSPYPNGGKKSSKSSSEI